jgi:N-acetylneuraminate synthase
VDIKKGQVLTRDMIDVLRPAVPGAILPYEIEDAVGAKALVDIPLGKELTWLMLGAA